MYNQKIKQQIMSSGKNRLRTLAYKVSKEHKVKMFMAYTTGYNCETIFREWKTLNWDHLATADRYSRIRAFLKWYNKYYGPHRNNSPVSHTASTPENIRILYTFQLND